MKTVLSPEEVLYLKGLGVKFENTTCVWVFLHDYEETPLLETAETAKSYDKTTCKTLPAPDLSEVLDKLPNVYDKSGERWFLLIDNRENVIVYAKGGEIKNDWLCWAGIKDHLLPAAYSLLCSIKKDTYEY